MTTAAERLLLKFSKAFQRSLYKNAMIHHDIKHKDVQITIQTLQNDQKQIVSQEKMVR